MSEVFLVCVRVIDLHTPVPGSSIDRCSVCGTEVWRHLVDAPEEAKPVCTPCAKVQFKNDPPEINLTESQRQWFAEMDLTEEQVKAFLALAAMSVEDGL